MPFSVHKRLALLGALAVSTVFIVGCSTSASKVKNSDNRLAALSVSAGALTPAFNITTDAYRLTVDGTVASTTVTATTNQSTSTLTINGAAATSGTASAAITLPAGNTVIPVTVTAENGVAHTYSVTITRVLSNDATLASLNVSKGILAPNFVPSVKAYELGLYSGEPSITVTPTTTHPRAKVTVNGVAVTSGTASAAIPLALGTTTIPVVVTAEDGSTVSTTKVDVRQLAPSMPVWVTSSANGAAVPGATLTLKKDDGTVLQSGIPVDANGYAKLCLDPLGKYTLVAQGPGTAQCTSSFDAGKERQVALYCHNLGMINFPASSPRITEISYSADGIAWTPIDGEFQNLLPNIKYIKVTGIGTAGISNTAWSGYAMGLSVDAPVWVNSITYPAYEVENSVPVVVDGLPFYQSTYIFQMAFNNTATEGQHYIDLVVYDVANNRTEQKLYVTVTNPVTAADPDISAVTPSSVFNVLNTYGITREFFALKPIDDNGVWYLPQIQFSVLSGGVAPGIRGVELYRSTDGTNFTKVSTTQYGSLNKGSSGVYTIYDLDPSLVENVTYHYKVRAFTTNVTNNGGFSLESAAVPSQFLPPFTTPLLSPAQSAVSMTKAPKFTFGITNPKLWDANVSDYFQFFLYIKDKVGSSVFSQAYRYNFAGAKFEKLSGGSWIDASADCSINAEFTQISIQFPNATTLLPGITYEWSIFGTKGSASYSTSDAAYFIRYTPGNTFGRARSYGSVYEKSYSAVNGFFTLTIDPAAQ